MTEKRAWKSTHVFRSATFSNTTMMNSNFVSSAYGAKYMKTTSANLNQMYDHMTKIKCVHRKYSNTKASTLT